MSALLSNNSLKIRVLGGAATVLFATVCLIGMFKLLLAQTHHLVYSNNLTESQYHLSLLISGMIGGPESLSEVQSYSAIGSYITTGLNNSLYSEDAIAAKTLLDSNSDVVMSMYYRLNSANLYLMGAVEVTEISIPPTFQTPCHANALVAKLNISCMPEYEISSPGRMIRGSEATYSANDGRSTLLYDLSEYVPLTSSRMIAIEFNVYDGVTSNVGIAQVVFERTRLGNIVSRSSVTTIPQVFVYMGGSGTTSEWLLVSGHITILVLAAVTLLVLIGRRILKRWWDSPTCLETLSVTISILCIASFGLQFQEVTSMPLLSVNLGVTRSVQLSEVADRFTTVNGINSVVIILLFFLLVSELVTPTDKVKLWSSVVAVSAVLMGMIALLINIRFSDILSFSQSFMLLTRVGLRYISASDFERLWRNGGFPLATLLALHAFVLYWLTGIVVGILMGPESPAKTVGPLVVNQPTGENKEEELMPSVEVFAGRALSEVSAVRDKVEAEIESARTELVNARIKISQIRNMMSTTTY